MAPSDSAVEMDPLADNGPGIVVSTPIPTTDPNATATPAAPAAAAAEKTEKVKKPGIGDFAMGLIRERKTNDEVLAAVKEQFPDASTTMASINWYRNKLRTDGENVPTSRELASEGKPAATSSDGTPVDPTVSAADAKKNAAAKRKADREAAKAARKPVTELPIEPRPETTAPAAVPVDLDPLG